MKNVKAIAPLQKKVKSPKHALSKKKPNYPASRTLIEVAMLFL